MSLSAVELADKSKAKHAKEVKHVATEHIHKKGDDYFLHFPKPTPKPKNDANRLHINNRNIFND